MLGESRETVQGHDGIPDYVKVRSKALGDARPAFLLLLVVPQWIWPGVFIEVEVVAARA
jgi:hypothetical protein